MSEVRTALIVGGDGLIGRALAGWLAREGWSVLGTTRRPGSGGGPGLRLDLAEDVTAWRPPAPVSVAFLCAAVTGVRDCESDPESTRRLNVGNTLTVARSLAESGAFVVFPSTNLVFDGSAPCREATEPVCPGTEYGRQKAAVERGLLALDGDAAVVRLTKVLGPRDALAQGWVRDLRQGIVIRPFRDKVFAPIPLPFAAEVLARVGALRLPGITQASADRDISYEDAARLLCRRLGAAQELVQPTDAGGDVPHRAFNPRHTTLCTARMTDRLGLRAPSPWEALEEVLAS